MDGSTERHGCGWLRMDQERTSEVRSLPRVNTNKKHNTNTNIQAMGCHQKSTIASALERRSSDELREKSLYSSVQFNDKIKTNHSNVQYAIYMSTSDVSFDTCTYLIVLQIVGGIVIILNKQYNQVWVNAESSDVSDFTSYSQSLHCDQFEWMVKPDIVSHVAVILNCLLLLQRCRIHTLDSRWTTSYFK